MISNTVFENIDAYLGGGLYLDHPQSMIISDSTFRNLRALNRSLDIKSDTPYGIAGAVYYGCSAIDPQCSLSISGNTVYSYNFAQIKGGAIHWDYYEPIFGPKVKFMNNTAGWYGDSISCYAMKLAKISRDDFRAQIDRINFPVTPT
jgi:hypothetical protein